MKKYQVTEKQVEQFNLMLRTLRRIDKSYMTIKQIQKADKVGLDYTEYLEMVYENVKGDAKYASKGVKLIEIKPDSNSGTITPQ